MNQRSQSQEPHHPIFLKSTQKKKKKKKGERQRGEKKEKLNPSIAKRLDFKIPPKLKEAKSLIYRSLPILQFISISTTFQDLVGSGHLHQNKQSPHGQIIKNFESENQRRFKGGEQTISIGEDDGEDSGTIVGDFHTYTAPFQLIYSNIISSLTDIFQ